MYISFDVYDCGKCTNTAALEKGVDSNLAIAARVERAMAGYMYTLI